MTRGQAPVEFNALCSLEAKRPTESCTASIVTADKAWRRPVVPVSIERKVPLQIADDLDVIGSVEVEAETAWIRNRRQQRSS